MNRKAKVRKPPVTTESAEAINAVYDHYDDPANLPSKKLTRRGQSVMSKVIRPKFIFIGDSESSITQHLQSGGQAIIASDHRKNFDSLAIASLMHRQAAFQPIRDRLTGIVKIPLLQDAHPTFSVRGVVSLLNPLLRWGVETQRSLPAYRPKDFLTPDGVPQENAAALSSLATNRLFGSIKKRGVNGESFGIYPGGKRNKGWQNRKTVDAFEEGTAVMASKLDKTTNGNTRIVPVATGYPGLLGRLGLPLRPTMVINEMIDPGPLKLREITPAVHAAIQQCVDVIYLQDGLRENGGIDTPGAVAAQDVGGLA